MKRGINMLEKIFWNKKYSGFIWHLLLAGVFIGLSFLGRHFTEGVTWFLISSFLRLVFGIAILFTASKLYGRKPSDILSFKGSGKALVYGAGLTLFFLYVVIQVIAGFGVIVGLTTGIFISRVILQQVTTGFFEEINYRFLMLEGLKHTKNNIWLRLAYIFATSVLFGLSHCIPSWDTYKFLMTSAMGIGFAVMLVLSDNIVIPMLIHFLYDFAVHISSFIEWNLNPVFVFMGTAFEVALIIMVVISLVMLVFWSRRGPEKANQEL